MICYWNVFCCHLLLLSPFKPNNYLILSALDFFVSIELSFHKRWHSECNVCISFNIVNPREEMQIKHFDDMVQYFNWNLKHKDGSLIK